MAPNDNGKGHDEKDEDKTASIEIDDEEYEVPRGDNLVETLIRITGQDPAVTDLVLIKGREQTRLADADTIKVNSGSKFVTVSTEPTPVA